MQEDTHIDKYHDDVSLLPEDNAFLEAGASDGLFLHFGKLSISQKVSDLIVRSFIEIAYKDNADAKSKLIDTLDKFKTVHLYKDVLLKLRKENPLPKHPYLMTFIKWMTFDSPHAETIKMGLALFSIFGCDKVDIYRIKKLADNEEFTHYCVVIIDSLLENADRHVFDIAQRVTGWGRISCLKLLSKTKDPEIQRWMLVEGYRNTIMNEYTAHLCATTGKLARQLSVDNPHNDVLNATTEILSALFSDGPSLNINSYKDAIVVCLAYLTHIKGRMGIKESALLIRMLNFINGDGLGFKKAKCLCGGDTCKSLAVEIEQVLASLNWDGNKCLINQNTYSEDLLLVANYFKLDMWEPNLQKLKSNPFNPQYWNNVFDYTFGERAVVVEEYLQVAFNWGDVIKNGGKYSHTAILNILDMLKGRSGVCTEFVVFCFKSNSIPFQTAALDVLKSWNRKHLPIEILKIIPEIYHNIIDDPSCSTLISFPNPPASSVNLPQ